MSEPMLTDADSIEVQEFYDAGRKQTREDKLSVDRWTKHGHDRLYINEGISKCDKYSLYVDLQTHEIVSDNDHKHKGGSVEIDGDEAVITIIEHRLSDREHRITVALTGKGFEASEDDSEAEPELVTDGGSDRTSHIDDETIEAAIEAEDGPIAEEDTETIAAVREALAWLQEGVEATWGEWANNIERDDARVVYEDSETIVLTTGEQDVPHRDLRDYYPDELGERVPAIASAVHHALARELCEYDWGYEYPIVLAKRGTVDDGQLYVEAVINNLLRRGLSPGQAWAYYGTEIRGNSNNSWAARCGYSDHSAVSEPLRKAKQKL